MCSAFRKRNCDDSGTDTGDTTIYSVGGDDSSDESVEIVMTRRAKRGLLRVSSRSTKPTSRAARCPEAFTILFVPVLTRSNIRHFIKQMVPIHLEALAPN
ncbi:hypothetical protein HPB50_000763 [Hyalomma asiaticum]|uniref:Uncharacterized protein n=1 Tax=Hyalomma asiaticum TaxID=266040 RepID=A0ACB7SU37_HYAAI|nr:hypothetical protein HPB50_000763 [Hyalomma asiaticum]